jgi:sulfite oxidase
MLLRAARRAAGAGALAVASAAAFRAPSSAWASPAPAPVPATLPARPPPPPAAPAAGGAAEAPERVIALAEVALHGRPGSPGAAPDGSVWVTHGGAVYDVSRFVAMHPGGAAKLLLAAGGALEPYWALYAQHAKPEVRALLETYRIGRLSTGDAAAAAAAAEASASAAGGGAAADAAYALEPPRHPALRPLTMRPFNAEPEPALLGDAPFTPAELFFVRNHDPVPLIDDARHVLVVDTAGVTDAGNAPSTAPPPPPVTSAAAAAAAAPAAAAASFSMHDLRDASRFPRREVESALQCAGNRRAHMSAGSARKATGLEWRGGAIGSGRWGGVLLRDVLLSLGVRDADVGKRFRHVLLEGVDGRAAPAPGEAPEAAAAAAGGGGGYGTSIPADVAMDPRRSVLLAFEYEGRPLSRDHGFPLRAIVPGAVAARQVKWLGRVALSMHESPSSWTQRDYKAFAQGVEPRLGNVDYSSMPAMQDMPVSSAITHVEVDAGGAAAAARGWAWSGGGRAIARVDVSGDGGRSWVVADVTHRPRDESPSGTQSFGWTLWRADDVPLPRGGGAQIVVKAMDVAMNVQPERFEPHWNWRGVAGTAFDRVDVPGNGAA